MFRPKISQASLIVAAILLISLPIFFYDIFFLGKTLKITTANSQALPLGAYGQLKNKPKFIPVNGTDAPVLEEPVYEFIKDSLWKGILPLWNPHQACGFPLIAMMEVGIFYPLNFILYLFPQIYAWDILILSRFFLGGILVYWLMRTWNVGRLAALVSALTFMYTGPMLVLQYWTVNVDILAPLLLICMEHLIKKPNYRNTVLVAIVVAMTFFAGHPEHVFLVNVFCFLFFNFRLFSTPQKSLWKKSYPLLMGAYVLGIGMSAMVLFPFLYNLLFEFWHAHPPNTGLGSGEVQGRILTLAVPFFFQKEPLRFDFEFSGWWGGYLGIMPLGLAFLSLFRRQKNGLNYFFAAIAFLLVSKQYGFAFINWIGYLPIFDTCRYAIHTPQLVALSIAIGAGLGTRTILFTKNIFKKGLYFSALITVLIAINFAYVPNAEKIVVALDASAFSFLILCCFQIVLWIKDRNLFTRFGVIASLIFRRSNPFQLEKIASSLKNTPCPSGRRARNDTKIASMSQPAWGGSKTFIISVLIFALLGFELFHYIHRERIRRFDSFAKVPYIEFLKQQEPRSRAYGTFWAFYPNTATGFQTDDLGIFFSLLPKRFVNFVNNLMVRNNFRNDLRPPALRMTPINQKNFLDLLNVRYLVTPPKEMLKTLLLNYEKLEAYQNPTYSDEVNIYERKTAFDRVFITHRAIFQKDDLTTLKILKRVQNILDRVIVINAEPDAAIRETLKRTPLVDSSSAQIIRYDPNEVIVTAQMENPGFLILSDGFHPDWDVFVDGKISKIYRTDYLIRSVFLSEGNHDVRFVFRPVSFYWGMIVSLGSILLGLFLFLRKKKAQSN